MLELLRSLERNLVNDDYLADFLIQVGIMNKCRDELAKGVTFIGVRKSVKNGHYYVRLKYDDRPGAFEFNYLDELLGYYKYYWRKFSYGRPVQNIIHKKGIV